MRNIVKKVAAFALAFTLLGTGTAVTKTITPNYDTGITASAYTLPILCSHPHPYYGWWLPTGKSRRIYKGGKWRTEWLYSRTIKYRCGECYKVLYSTKEYKWV
ncbi:MAG TPA: hypothetical protein PLS20_08800 [Ruminococcus flavefaciens]|nr:hypothetical protein [Ruminococcus flavefaciens]